MSSDPHVTDPESGVDHAEVLSTEEAQAVLDRCWKPMHEQGVHLATRPFEENGVTEGIVIVARGKAARMLKHFCRTQIPSFDGSPPPGG